MPAVPPTRKIKGDAPVGKKSAPVVLTAPEWEIQDREPADSYHDFLEYLQMPSESRGFGGLAALRGHKSDSIEYKRERNRLGNLSSKWKWQERIKKHEQYLANLYFKDVEKARREANKRHAEYAKAANVGAMSVVKQFMKNLQAGMFNLEKVKDELTQLKIFAAAVDKMIQAGEFERKVRGEPTEIIQSETKTVNEHHHTVDVKQLPKKELEKLALEAGFEFKGV